MPTVGAARLITSPNISALPGDFSVSGQFIAQKSLTGAALESVNLVSMGSPILPVLFLDGVGHPNIQGYVAGVGQSMYLSLGVNLLIGSYAGGNSMVINNTGTITSYGGHVTAGRGVAAVYAVTLQKAETGADASLLSFTPPAVAGHYLLEFSLDVSAAVAAVLGWTATWTDSNSNANAPTNLTMYQSGVLTGGLTLTLAAAGHLYGSLPIDIDASATPIVIKITFSGTSYAAKATAVITQTA